MTLVSVIMNCYNGQDYLVEAINSLINQTYKKWELIFWDNLSTDSSSEIVRSYEDNRIKYFRAKKHGTLGEGRSKAIKKISGKYITFLDTDDIWHPSRLKECIDAFQASKGICLVYSNTKFFNQNINKILYKKEQPSGLISNNLLTNYNLSLESVSINRDYLDILDIKFDKDFSHIADFDLFVRISLLGKAKYINKVLCGWRIHGNNESIKRSDKFIKEKELWIKKYKNHKLFSNYVSEIEELDLTCKAEKKLNSSNIFDVNSLIYLRRHKFISKRNLFKYLLSCIPIFKIIYKLK